MLGRLKQHTVAREKSKAQETEFVSAFDFVMQVSFETCEVFPYYVVTIQVRVHDELLFVTKVICLQKAGCSDRFILIVFYTIEIQKELFHLA